MNKEDIENLIDDKIQFAEKKYGAEVKNLLIETLGLEKMLRPDKQQQTRYIPVGKWNEYHPYPTVYALRNLIFRAKDNGLNNAIQRKGKRVLIDENAFFEWLKLKQKTA